MICLDYVILFSFSLVLRYGVSLWPYSGMGVPPMHGDYEAQRHWQEITVNLPLSDWYNQTKDNDLMYWGLDYPPLTAYHSYLVGRAGQWVNSSFTELQTSRGIESIQHKLFMRTSVILADLAVLFPGIFLLSGSLVSGTGILLALYPGLILIDHGHFQYNNISLGLFIIATSLVSRNRDVLGSIFFCLALNYKQMELYHALPFFFFLLAKSWNQLTFCKKITKVILIGVTVVLTFLFIWSPFLHRGLPTTLQVLKRIFPVDRGIFEDKVANFWCSVDILLKLKNRLDISQLGVICLITTFIASLPSNLHLLFKPSNRSFLFALLNTSLVFFLFSFHVHEKSILLVAIPAILAGSILPQQSLYCSNLLPWFLSISTFSMLPLLYKDGLLIPSSALFIMYLVVHQNMHFILPRKQPKQRISSPLPVEPESVWERSLALIQVLSILGCIILTLLFVFYPPPSRYPYLWPAVISLYFAVHYILSNHVCSGIPTCGLL
ncbi:probable dolichyl pyrophosphate Man9GlcNAc2 alpha-1,3-glucosyltransferase isoform X2 [Eurytemora carolleeae]|uniref:probable dolichyl pyrophosphate Man9GlcNAc2 alpha-1,3-glucosyltransferase isoform X2 n=1 Tax=Eurytemora carolleeae TaxID=1294199 RepID=UPI000C75D0C9|nr:probable dolichyl pyrophosphate Man9GlcNAc2 alpha-1,3-glucosyltransferase isoform X2 [Eurytemora carolleeae]|eukprot:XP_023336079.1 probable dolichyl pyrophosphate Man9GlcNAc2 alpha-1,3-glucosyltransferase isoform X2 [Eurytemora affinis]